jgi:plastocyanin
VTARLAAALLCGALLSAPAAGKAKTHVVLIDGTQYAPARIEVAVGDTVVWKNRDPFPHTVTAQDGSFDSHPIGADRSWKLKVRRAGVLPYICTLHPNMKGEIVAK